MGTAVQLLGDGFVRLIKAVIAPLVFCVVVTGIARAGNLRAFGRIGVKALLWFEVATTLGGRAGHRACEEGADRGGRLRPGGAGRHGRRGRIARPAQGRSARDGDGLRSSRAGRLTCRRPGGLTPSRLTNRQDAFRCRLMGSPTRCMWVRASR